MAPWSPVPPHSHAGQQQQQQLPHKHPNNTALHPPVRTGPGATTLRRHTSLPQFGPAPPLLPSAGAAFPPGIVLGAHMHMSPDTLAGTAGNGSGGSNNNNSNSLASNSIDSNEDDALVIPSLPDVLSRPLLMD